MAINQFSKQSHPYTRGARALYTWSARFSLERPSTLEDIVTRQLGGLVTGFVDPEWPISGAVHGVGDAEDRTTVVLGLDPSRGFGTPSVERCEVIANKITETLGWKRRTEEPLEMRVIMGRRIGYDGQEYTLEEVRGLTVAHNCGNLALTEADLFSLRYAGGLREYHEPGVMVEGAASDLDALLHVAADMGQERLVPEITGVETQVYQK